LHFIAADCPPIPAMLALTGIEPHTIMAGFDMIERAQQPLSDGVRGLAQRHRAATKGGKRRPDHGAR